MPLLLPNLDDRTWADLVDEGRALLPVYGPEWTDHNASDPGITLIELLAWFSEMEIYGLNQVSDRDRLKFLRLVDVVPYPPEPARDVLCIALADGANPLALPAGVEFLGQDASLVATRYHTHHAVTLAPGTVQALQFRNGTAFQDLTAAWRRRSGVNPFGVDPKPGMEFYIGLSAALPVDTDVEFFFSLGGDRSGWDERRRILEELCAREKDCRPQPNPCCPKPHDQPHDSCGHGKHDKPDTPLIHYGVRTVWEFLGLSGGSQAWLPLDAAAKQVVDNTRSLTLSGHVAFRVPGAMAAKQIGATPGNLYYLRCRIAAGTYDAAPILLDVAFNGVAVEQASPCGMTFVIDAAASITYAPPGPPKSGDVTPLTMAVDATKTTDGRWRIVALNFAGDPAKDPGFLIYDYRAPAGSAVGLLAIEGVFLGFANGFPNQTVVLPDAPVVRESVRLYTLEQNQWLSWKLRYDFDSSSRRDFNVQMDPSTGNVTFGDGEKGRVPPELRAPAAPPPSALPLEQCLIFAKYATTRAQAGNLAAGLINQLADSPHNRAVLSNWSIAQADMTSIVNPLPAAAGSAAETVAHASGRADSLVSTGQRAVTLADYEQLAIQTPGTRVARVTAWANRHPSFPCLKAPGMVTVIVLPFLPEGRPVPTTGLLDAVSAYLRRRRIIGTRVEVVGPTYLEVSVQAQVQSLKGANKVALQAAVVAALGNFLDPLVGGPDGTGWPFGRDVYRSEIMRIIGEVPGVDYVASLELIGEDGQPQCGNICLSPTWLVAAGTHQITVL